MEFGFAVNKKTKICTKCRKRKRVSQFYRQAASPDGLGPWCKKCMDEVRTANRLANIERTRSYARAYYQRPEQKEKKSKYGKANRKAHRLIEKRYELKYPARRRESNRRSLKKRLAEDPEGVREAQRQGTKRYHERYPERIKNQQTNSNARRRLRLKAAFIESICRRTVFDRDGGRCHLCGKFVAFSEMHVDHVIPLAVGGEHSYNNVAVSCSTCNLRKPRKMRLAA